MKPENHAIDDFLERQRLAQQFRDQAEDQRAGDGAAHRADAAHHHHGQDQDGGLEAQAFGWMKEANSVYMPPAMPA